MVQSMVFFFVFWEKLWRERERERNMIYLFFVYWFLRVKTVLAREREKGMWGECLTLRLGSRDIVLQLNLGVSYVHGLDIKKDHVDSIAIMWVMVVNFS